MRAIRIAMIAGLAAAMPPAAAFAQEPVLRQGSAEEEMRRRLFADLKAATSEAEGRAAEDAIWRFWLTPPDAETARLLAAAMDRRSDYDLAGARALLDQAIARSPDYAEAWNQRGFIRFLQEDLDGGLSDVDRAIALEPKHFAAMAGRAVILRRQARFRLAQDQLKQAVAIHPFLKERSLLLPDPGIPPAAPPAPDGIDL